MPRPDQLGWGPGWPRCQTDKLVTVQLSTGIRLPVRREAAPLFAHLCHETEARGYDIRPGQTWTFACRPVRGYEDEGIPSDHSWALAIDQNALTNPMLRGQPGWRWLHDHGRTDMPSWLPPLWMAHGFEWGGNYPRRQDAMHFGYDLTPAHMAATVASLRNHGDGDNPRPPFRLTRTLHEGMRGDDVKEAQNVLILLAARYKNNLFLPGTTKGDGKFGPLTARATLNFKAAVRGNEEMAGRKRYSFYRPFSPTIGVATFGVMLAWVRL